MVSGDGYNMELNDWLMLITLLCLMIGTTYVCFLLKKMRVAIDLTRKDVEKQTKQLIRHRLKQERG